MAEKFYMDYDKKELLEKSPCPIKEIPNLEELHRKFVDDVISCIGKQLDKNEPFRFAIPVGPFDYEMLAEKINEKKIPGSKLWVFQVDEFCDHDGRAVPPDHPWNLRSFQVKTFFSKLEGDSRIPESQQIVPDPLNIGNYSESIKKAGGLDVVYFGFGITGHIGFLDPAPYGGPHDIGEFSNGKTKIVHLCGETITQCAMGGCGGNMDIIPRKGITIGMRDILDAGELHVYLMRDWQAAGIRKFLFGPKTTQFPVSLVKDHKNIRVWALPCVLDKVWFLPTQKHG